MTELCKGMEWNYHFSSLILCAMNDWSPSDPLVGSALSDSDKEEPGSSISLGRVDLNVTLPNESIDEYSNFMAEMSKLEDLQKQAAQTSEVC